MNCCRAGMTLVELLVVVAILVLLSAVVLPTIAGREGDRGARIAAANVSSHFAKAQSISISRRESHGVWLAPLPTSVFSCIDLYFADVPKPYRGDSFEARFTVTLAAPATATLVETPLGCVASLSLPAFGNFNTPGNLIQFNDGGPFYDFRSNGGSHVASRRVSASQNPRNTPWPAESPASHRFAIYRLPTRSGQPLTLGNGMAIDVAWSGIATRRFGAQAFNTVVLGGDGSSTGPSVDDWMCDNDNDYDAACGKGPGSLPATLVVMFDASGAFAEMVYIANAANGVTVRVPADGPLYLLVGRVDRCGLPYNPAPTDANPGANWQYPESRWISINPKTGAIKTAEVVLNVPTARESQSLIRAGLTTSGP